jgi:hypothetical protein
MTHLTPCCQLREKKVKKKHFATTFYADEKRRETKEID